MLTLDDIYAFNPNFGTAPDFEPSLAVGETAAEFQGLNCGLRAKGFAEAGLTDPLAGA